MDGGMAIVEEFESRNDDLQGLGLAHLPHILWRLFYFRPFYTTS